MLEWEHCQECDQAEQFVFNLGILSIVGPSPSDFQCGRGQFCTHLSLAGLRLLEEDKIRIQNACGGLAVQITTGNLRGEAVDIVRGR